MRFTAIEVAEKLGKSSSAIGRWASDGIFPNAYKEGNFWRIPEEDVNNLLVRKDIEDRRVIKKTDELVGKTFGTMTILSVVGYRKETENHGRLFVEIRCKCGEIKEIPFYNIERGSQKYCSNQCPAKSGFYIGQQIHNVIIIEDLGIEKTNSRGKRKVRVRCRCGEERDVFLSKLKVGSVKSCSKNCKLYLNDLIGKRFGCLLVLKELDRKQPENRLFLCECDCGKFAEKEYKKLVTGWTKFCGHKCILQTGEGSPSWNPEISEEERIKRRDYYEYNQWRNKVFFKDSFACQCCGKIGNGMLIAHHKDGYHWCEERRLDVTNGVTLCESCHDNFHSNYGYRNNTEAQYIEWLQSKKVSV